MECFKVKKVTSSHTKKQTDIPKQELKSVVDKAEYDAVSGVVSAFLMTWFR